MCLAGDMTVRGVLCVWQEVCHCKRGGVCLAGGVSL